ncbi:hypothetical protein PROFUN_13584 [Planoprotostelium fungivorum]|uniref:RING-type E3 ubiquitin transferase n=1 Tax=Planoprotostelium fungivorum TaxID=1890364 RepID=A0A2P6N3J3_9EUKA|nr:hypothetical protein PROFUN_13584 [Planoprotostelium fungivorum]
MSDSDWTRAAAIGVGIAGLGCVAVSRSIYHPRLQHITSAPYRRLTELSDVSRDQSIYCKIHGRVEGERYISAPLSGKNVVLWRLRHWSNPFLQTKDTPMWIMEGNEKVSVDIKGASFNLDESDYLSSIEHIIEAGSPAFIVGEIIKNDAGAFVIRQPQDGRPFIFSTKSEQETVQQLRNLKYTWLAVGGILIAGSLARLLVFGEDAVIPKWLESFVVAIHSHR